MLTATPPDTDVSVAIDIGSTVVRLAVAYVVSEHGWARCRHDAPGCRCLSVTDRARTGSIVEVLVSRDTPAACQASLDAVLGGTARSVVLWDEPETIPQAIDGLGFGSVIVPARVIDCALLAPRLTSRQRRTVQLIAAGRTNQEIAAQLYQSMSTTKRDLAELLQLFDVPNRSALLTAAAQMGFV